MGRRIDPGDGVGAAVGDPNDAAADRDAGWTAPDRDRRAGDGVSEVDTADRPGRSAADPEAAGAGRESQRHRLGGYAAPEHPGALRIDRRDARAILVRHPDTAAGHDDRAGPPADLDPLGRLPGEIAVEAKHVPRTWAGDPDGAFADRDTRDPPADPQRPVDHLLRFRVNPREGAVRGAGHPERVVADGEPQRARANRDW